MASPPFRRRLSRIAACLFLIPGLLVSEAVAAQQAAPPSEAARVSAGLGPGVGVSTVQGEAALVWAGHAGLRLGSTFWLGGAGVILTPVDYGASAPRRLRLGYGGLEFEAAVPGLGPSDWRVGALLGGGNADVSDILTGVELGSDNFLVLEPRISWIRPLSTAWSTSVRLGYRLAIGVDDLPDSDAGDISGPLVFLGLTVIRP